MEHYSAPSWLLSEIVENIVKADGSATLSLTSFNRLMLNCRRPLASEQFFQWAFSGVTTVDDFEEAVDRYRVSAMWIFGNFKFAYRRFATCPPAELEQLTAKLSERPISLYTARSKFNEIAEIPDNDLHLLGYLSSAKIERLFYLESLASIAADQNDLVALIDKLPTTIKSQLIEELKGQETADVTQFAAKIIAESAALLRRQEEARDIGRQNTFRYLSLPHIDVYVATSMRDAQDFVAQHAFTKAVFEHESVKDLHLRFFDPNYVLRRRPCYEGTDRVPDATASWSDSLQRGRYGHDGQGFRTRGYPRAGETGDRLCSGRHRSVG